LNQGSFSHRFFYGGIFRYAKVGSKEQLIYAFTEALPRDDWDDFQSFRSWTGVKSFRTRFFQLSFVTVDENKEHGYSKQCSAKKLQEAAQFHGVLKIGRSGQSEIGRSGQSEGVLEYRHSQCRNPTGQ
jgi:hypothetical protein